MFQLLTKGFIVGILLFYSTSKLLAQRNPQPDIDSLFNQLQETSSDSGKIDLYIALSDAYLTVVPDSSLYYANEALKLAKTVNTTLELAKSHAAIAIYYHHSEKEYEISENHFEKADSLFKNVDNPKQKSQFKFEYCVHLSQQLKLDTSIIVCESALAIAEQNNFENLIAKLNERLAYIHYYQGDYELALHGFRTSIDAFEKMGEYEKVADAYSSIGSIFDRIGDQESAIIAQEKALKIYEKYNLKDGICITSTNLAGKYRAVGRLKEAKALFLKAIELGELTNYTLCLGTAYSNISDIYIDEKKYDLAIRTLNKAIPFTKENNNVFVEEYIYGRLGRAHEKLNELDQAEAYFQKALEFINKRNNLDDQTVGYEDIAEFYSRTGNYQKAYKNISKVISLKDSIYTIERTKEISKLQVEFETTEKEQENALLRKDNELQNLKIQQQQQNLTIGVIVALFFLGLASFLFFQRKKLRQTKKHLEISVKEKETLLKEIHHRVKNNLQLITSLLSLQAKGNPEQTIEEFLYKGQNRVKSIALIHERLYRAENLTSIDFSIYAKELLSSIFENFNVENENISYQLESETTLLDIEKAIPLGLILNELVSNSMKHAFQGQPTGRLDIAIKNAENQVYLKVQDNGIGYENTQPEKGTMGLQLVKLLVQQLKGTFQMDNQNGTVVNVSFQNTVAEFA